MLYTNDGSSATYKKGKSIPYSEQLAEALEKHSKAAKEKKASESLTSDDDMMSDKYDSDTSSSLSFSDSDNETIGKADINKVFEDLDEKTKVMFEVRYYAFVYFSEVVSVFIVCGRLCSTCKSYFVLNATSCCVFNPCK